MKLDNNDPRLTAYVLGELDDNEKLEVERMLAESSEAQAAVDEIRRVGKMLEECLQAEPAPRLTQEHWEKVEDGVAARHRRRRPLTLVWRRARLPLAIAASVALLVFVWPGLFPSLQRARSRVSPARLALQNQEYINRSEEMRTAKGKEQPSVAHGEKQLALHDNEQSGLVIARGNLGGKAGSQPPGDFSYASKKDEGNVQPVVASVSSAVSVDSAELSKLRALGYVDYADDYGGRRRQEAKSAESERPGSAVGHATCGGTGFNTEAYDQIIENPFLAVLQNPLSTFSIDVDTASYSNMRRFLSGGSLPPAGSVRIEELINYFDYDYPIPSGNTPFSVNVEIADCPWNAGHRLARIGLKGHPDPAAMLGLEPGQRLAHNLVFLIDVSGSMHPANKLPLLKTGMKMLAEQLTEGDRVAIVVYAGATGLVLPSIDCGNAQSVIDALDQLQSGGSTNGGAGIELAYKVAADNFVKGGVNRVILATDGDFNVGTTNQSELIELIEKKAKTGVFLTVLGFGMGNYKDSTLEKLADKGNGNYAYIDTEAEARKVLVEEMTGTLVTIAKDVKIQIEFNPAEVGAYRLLGYENRIMAKEDFNDDTKDAGEIGAGHTVTALYEIVPAGMETGVRGVDPLKYQPQPTPPPVADSSGEMMTVKLRYKLPDGDRSTLMSYPIVDQGLGLSTASGDFHFAASVASFGMLLRSSQYSGNSTYAGVLDLAAAGLVRGGRVDERRQEFMELVRKAELLAANR